MSEMMQNQMREGSRQEEKLYRGEGMAINGDKMIISGWEMMTDLLSLERDEVISSVVQAGQEAAGEISQFRESKKGALILMAVPLHQTADVWLGGLSERDDRGRLVNVNEYVWVRPVQPGGSHTIMWRNPETGETEPVNCMAYAMAKIAYLSRLVKEGIINKSEDPEGEKFLEENGYSLHRGAVGTTLYYAGMEFMRFYVAVSGATEDEDLKCAAAATFALRTAVTSVSKRMAAISRCVDGEMIFRRDEETGRVEFDIIGE